MWIFAFLLSSDNCKYEQHFQQQPILQSFVYDTLGKPVPEKKRSLACVILTKIGSE